MKLPKVCEIFPSMGIHSQDTKHAGAWRLWVLAASLDRAEHGEQDGSRTHGRIERATLEAAALKLGVKRSTFFHWLADARKAKMLNGTREYLYIASQEKTAPILLCNSIDKSKAIIPLKLLFKPGWKDIVWAAYLKANHHKIHTKKVQKTYEGKPITSRRLYVVGKVISAKTLEDLTGVPARTQRRLTKHIKTRRNIAITTIPGSRETAAALNKQARDHGQARHYFPYNDMEQKDPAGVKDYRRVIAFTTPARRTVSNQSATIGARGRRAQIERAILKGLQLVTVCNYPNSYYPARPGQAARQTEAKSYQRRYYDAYHKPRTGVIRAGEYFVERRDHVGVWDRREREA